VSHLAISYNQPTFSSCATWNPNGTTFANISTIGSSPYSIFINTNNTVYAIDRSSNQVLMWPEESTNATTVISSGLQNSLDLFVSSNGDVYVGNNAGNYQIEKWAPNATSGITVMNVTSSCISLFIDTNNSLYCSNDQEHKVVKASLSSDPHTVITAAGNSTQGSGPYMLYSPFGIFVDINFTLYVADCGNNRIQSFKSGQLSGTTVAGIGAPGTITLNYPTGIAFDADSYLFIVDHNNNRIIGSGPNGFRCIIGCAGTPGSVSYQLQQPRALAFDSYGNLFVADTDNNRLQKFHLATNSCGM
jgi:hypothetical protein